jgi:competence protein ComEA
MTLMKKVLLPLLPLAVFPALAQNAAIENLPDAKGKAVVEKVCSVCHEPTAVGKYRKSKEDWQAVIDDMVTRGADATDQEFDTVIDYLAKCFGPAVKINTIAAADLEKQLELSNKEAAAIVQYRQSNGAFKELADLKKVPGLDYSKIEPVRYRITF